MARSDGGSSLDVVVAAGLFAVLSLGVRISTYVLVPDAPLYGTLWFSILGGATPLALSYWTFGRCWWLMRGDGARTVVMGVGIVALAAYDVYTNLWGFILYSLPFIEFVDYLAIGVRLAGMVMVVISLTKWSRTPTWFTAVAYGYLGAFVVAVFAKQFVPILVTLSGLAGVVFMLSLAVSLFSYERSIRDLVLDGA